LLDGLHYADSKVVLDIDASSGTLPPTCTCL
jgi:hypothetical protein